MRDLEPEARLDLVAKTVGLEDADGKTLAGHDVLPLSLANGMIENVIGKFELPLAVATNFTINDKDYLVPMVVEEPSVVAAASYMAKIARSCGGFHTSSDRPVMRAQVQVVGLTDPNGAKQRLLAAEAELRQMCNARDEVLVSLGGGCIGIEVHVFETSVVGPMAVLHILVDVRDAMGANAVNSMAETIAPRVAEIAGGHTRLRILSNLADRRLARAYVTLTPDALTTRTMDGRDVIDGMIEACALAQIDPYEAWFYERGGMEMAARSYAPAGLTYVAPTVYGEEPLHSKVEIRTIADMDGLKGRFVGLAAAVMADFGVAVSPLPTSEVYSALDKGLVDFADRGDIKANYEEGLHEVAKYLILPGIHQPSTATCYVANTAAYGQLDDQQRAALAVAAREVSGALRQNIIVDNAEYLAKFEDAGVEIISFDPDDVAQSRGNAVASWEKATNGDALATEMMQSQKELMADLRLL